MKPVKMLLSEPCARKAARFMQYACYVILAFMLLCLILSCLGRQTFALHSGGEFYQRAIYAEENHAPHSRSLTVSSGDDVHVWTNEASEIDVVTQIGLTVMYALQLVPLMFAYWLLSRVFANVNKGKIFIEENARHLLGYGCLQFFTAVAAPFLKLLVCWVTNLLSTSRMSVSTGQNMLNTLIPSIAFLVAAYIIHYGIQLQDEVDHTL